MAISESEQLRILVVDDEEENLDLFDRVLGDRTSEIDADRFGQLSQDLFGKKWAPETTYHLALCRQGNDAVAAIQKSLDLSQPYAMAFIDMRMPPGPDGLWTAEQIRKIDPDIIIIFVTAYSDYDSAEISARVPPVEKLLYLQKPMHYQEISHFAAAIGTKWLANQQIRELLQELEIKVETRTKELEQINISLNDEIKERGKSLNALETSKQKLKGKTIELEEKNLELRRLLKKRDFDKDVLEQKLAIIDERVLFNLNELFFPYIERMKSTNPSPEQQEYLRTMENNIRELIDSLSTRVSNNSVKLTPTENQIASFIKQGLSTKEISEQLDIGLRTIEFHRANIRKKLNISRERANLKSALLSAP